MGVIGCIIVNMFRTDSLQITRGILQLIARIDEFKGAWRALGTLAPDRLSALRRVATIESIGSSTRIEGSKLSDREVEQLLSNLEIKSFATRDEQEPWRQVLRGSPCGLRPGGLGANCRAKSVLMRVCQPISNNGRIWAVLLN